MLETESHRLRAPEEVLRLANTLARGCARSEQVAIGLSELLMNAIEHGNLGIGFEYKRALLAEARLGQEVRRRLQQVPGSGREVRVRVSRYIDVVRFEISDDGEGFDWAPWMRHDAARMSAPNGRGIVLARKLCFESLNYRAPGNVVEAVAIRSAF